MRFFISIFFLSLTFNICVLTAQSIREQADKAFANKNYHQASILYDQWVKALPNDYYSHIQLAISYIHIKNNHKAALTLCTAINAGLQEEFLVQDTLFTPLFIHFDTLFIHQLQLPVHNGKTIQDLVIQKIKEQSKASTFPLKFTEQKRIGRYRVLYPTEYDSTLQYNLCLVLHGNSQNPEFILQWVQSLHIKNTLFISPEAPYLKFKESIYAGESRFSAAGEDQSFPDTLKDDIVNMSTEWYHDVLLDAIKTLPINNVKPAIMGFSQGGFYASVLASRYAKDISTAIVLCGSMYKEANIIDKIDDLKKHNVDLLLVHGTKDMVVPFQTAELFHNTLIEKQVQHTFIPFDGGHWPSIEMHTIIQKWFDDHFSR